jgi:uncharacterized protein YwgA
MERSVVTKMEDPQITLKLVLDELGISPDISTLNNRIEIQKAIFLAKYAGVDLGYSYSWYIHGPYSPELTKDYYILDNCLSKNENGEMDFQLLDSVTMSLNKTKEFMKIPDGVDLSRPQWLEFISSVIYWLKFTGDVENAKERIQREKADLYKPNYFEKALDMIKRSEVASS